MGGWIDGWIDRRMKGGMGIRGMDGGMLEGGIDGGMNV